MQFANLNKKLDRRERLYNSEKKKSKKIWIKRIIIVIILLFCFLYLPLRGAYQSARSIVAAGRGVSAGLNNQNLDEIRTNLTAMKKGTDGLNFSLNFLVWMRIIPFVGGYYADARHFAIASSYELEAAQKLADKLDPHKAELGFNNTPTPGIDKISQLVKILNKVIPELDSVKPELAKAAEEVESIDVNKYPEKLGNRNIRALVETAKGFIIGANVAVTEHKDALDVAPNALGEPTKKTYMIIFQNDKELRPTGGFMTAYTFMTLDKGRLSTTTSDDIYRLDEQLLKVCQSRVCPLTPPQPVSIYLPEANGKPRTAWSMRDSNFSPDVPTSMAQFEKFYSLLGNGLPFDGIILIDTKVLVELLKITGPVDVYGTTVSSDEDSRCDCPNVVYVLENYSQVIEKGGADRKAILGVLMQQILSRVLNSSPEKMPEFINSAVKLANSKNIIFYMHDQKLQSALTKLDWTGQIADFSDDYLMINDANLAGGKTNIYLEEKINLDINVDNSGRVKHKLTIDYSNPKPYNSWLNGINRNYVRVYVPQGSKLTYSKGSDAVVQTIDNELNKTVFAAFVQTRPQNSRTLTLEYELPEKFTGDEYSLMIQKQPGTKDYPYTIKINGRQKDKFDLTGDKILEFDI